MWRAHCPPREVIERVAAALPGRVEPHSVFAAGGANNFLARWIGQSLSDQHLAVSACARYAAGGGGGGFGGLGGGGFGGLGGSMGQPIPGLSPAVAEEMVTHVYLCVKAVGEFFDFVTDCFIASSVPIDIRTPSTRPCSLRRNLIGRAKYTEPAGSLHETSSTPAWLLPERRVLHRHDRFPDRP